MVASVSFEPMQKTKLSKLTMPPLFPPPPPPRRPRRPHPRRDAHGFIAHNFSLVVAIKYGFQSDEVSHSALIDAFLPISSFSALPPSNSFAFTCFHCAYSASSAPTLSCASLWCSLSKKKKRLREKKKRFVNAKPTRQRGATGPN